MGSPSLAGLRLLVVEDDPAELQGQLHRAFTGLELLPARTRAEALGLVRGHAPSVALLDLDLPPEPHGAGEGLATGFATLAGILEISPATKVVVMTGQAGREHAVRAVGSGAYDVHQKPIEPALVGLVLQRAHHLAGLEAEHRRGLAAPAAAVLPGIVGDSPTMQGVCRTAERVAPAEVSVVLSGESGTGKEVLARALHSLGPRREGRFVAINCAAIPEPLLEAELFGYERGAFTGASKQTPGRIELADGGTLFLDEIGDLPLGLQAKLLRFLQERVVERLGGRREIAVDVRVVSATHRDLARMIGEGSFREDLYYRLAEITLEVPPLRDRPGDAVLLARHLLREYAPRLGRRPRGFTEAALRAIDGHAWPGNVRELQNRVKRGVVMCDGPLVTVEDLGLEPAPELARALDLKRARERAEIETLRRALARAQGNLSQAARLLGVSRPTLYDLLRQHGLRD
jgi:two-component system NtrC family response regulator